MKCKQCRASEGPWCYSHLWCVSAASYLSCDNWSSRRSMQAKSLRGRWEPWSLWLANEWVAMSHCSLVVLSWGSDDAFLKCCLGGLIIKYLVCQKGFFFFLFYLWMFSLHCIKIARYFGHKRTFLKLLSVQTDIITLSEHIKRTCDFVSLQVQSSFIWFYAAFPYLDFPKALANLSSSVKLNQAESAKDERSVNGSAASSSAIQL